MRSIELCRYDCVHFTGLDHSGIPLVFLAIQWWVFVVYVCRLTSNHKLETARITSCSNQGIPSVAAGPVGVEKPNAIGHAGLLVFSGLVGIGVVEVTVTVKAKIASCVQVSALRDL